MTTVISTTLFRKWTNQPLRAHTVPRKIPKFRWPIGSPKTDVQPLWLLSVQRSIWKLRGIHEDHRVIEGRASDAGSALYLGVAYLVSEGAAAQEQSEKTNSAPCGVSGNRRREAGKTLPIRWSDRKSQETAHNTNSFFQTDANEHTHTSLS